MYINFKIFPWGGIKKINAFLSAKKRIVAHNTLAQLYYRKGIEMWTLAQLFFLACLSALQASFVQFYGFIPIKYVFLYGYALPMFIANLAFAFCCFAWNRTFAIICICLQCFVSLFLCTYVNTLGTQPTLMGLVNGISFVKQMNTGLWPYIDIPLILIFSVICCIMIFLRIHSGELHIKLRISCIIIALSLFSVLHYGNHNTKSYLLLSPERLQEALKSGRVHSISETNARRGYAMSTVIQILTGTLSTKQGALIEGTCEAAKTADIPLPYVGKRVVLLQVESLGWELLQLHVNGQEVMPFISHLAKNGLLLKLDGLKKLGSANSDYELLNAKNVLEERIYYGGITRYPDSILTEATRRGYDIGIVHGLTGEYMDRRIAYSLMGVQKQYFYEELRKAGYPVYKPFGGFILDNDLFDYSKNILQELSTPSLLFVITISMHEPALVPEIENFKNSPYAAFYSASTHTDTAIKDFVQSAPDDTTFVIYGDHRPYQGEQSGFVPFIIYTKQKTPQNIYVSEEIYTRCETGHYLRRVLHFDPLPENAALCVPDISPANAATKNSPTPKQ